LECALVLVVFGFFVILAWFGLVLGIYAVRKMNPRWIRIHTKVWRVATFSMEMGQGKPPGELESGEDWLRWCPPWLRRRSPDAPVKASPPGSVSVSVSLNWQRRGEAKAYFPAGWDEIQFFWPTNYLFTRPGVYRITVIEASRRLI
jgi:hypothetical protein